MLVKVKWGAETYSVEVDQTQPVSLFKAQLQSLTSVPAEKQKIMGVKGGQLKDDADLTSVGLTEGKLLMLIGSAEQIATVQPQQVFAEDVANSGGHSASVAAITGLVNVGNTCYMNSAIQLLRSVPELRKILADAKSPLPKRLQQLFITLDNTKTPVPPMAFWTSLIAAYPTFGQTDDHMRPMQHDSQEALSSMLQSIREDTQGTANAAEFEKLFTGKMQQTTWCPSLPERAKREENIPFTILPCSITGEVQTLEAGLEQAMNETFNGTVEGTEGEVMFQKTSHIAELPEYLFVHFIRFHWRKDINGKAKVLKPITFPLTLDVHSLCSESLKKELEPERLKVRERRDREVERRKRQRQKNEESEDVTAPVQPASEMKMAGYYELSGVISHKGRSADGGHYISWLKKNGQWLVADDSNSGEVSEEDVRRLRGVGEAHIAYVLLYRSRDPITGETPLPL